MEATSDVQLRRISLRFRTAGLEDAYLRHQSGKLMASLWWVTNFMAALSVISILVQSLARKSSWPSTATEVIDGTSTIYGAWGALSLCMAVLTRCGCLVRRFKPSRWELIATVYLLTLMLFTPAASLWYFAMLRNTDPEVVLSTPGVCDRFSDTGLILFLMGLTAVGHVLLPIRWCAIWTLEVAAVLIYVVMVFGMKSPERKDMLPSRVFLFTFIEVCFCVGKRQAERDHRYHFATIAEERTQRCISEFKLQKYERRSPHNSEARTLPGQGPLNDGGMMRPTLSVVSSTPTGTVFEGFQQDLDVERGLAEIVKIGEQESWLLPAEDVRLNPELVLGSGSYGIVVRGCLYGQEVVVKLSKDAVTSKQLRTMATELRVLRHVRHPNIVLFHGACVDPRSSELAIVLELVRGCCLSDFVLGRHSADGTLGPVPPEHDRGFLLLDICRALRYLHERRPRIVHGDLKATNVMVEFLGEPRAKLVDFGLARVVTRSARPLGGTPQWMAPELVAATSALRPSPAADVFSFGRLVYFIATGDVPLKGWTASQLRRAASSRQFPELRWPVGSAWTRNAQGVAAPCMLDDPERRPTMHRVQCQLHAWLGGAAQQRPLGDASAWTPGSSPADGLPFDAGLWHIRENLRGLSARPPPGANRTAGEMETGGSLAWPELKLTPSDTRCKMVCAALEAWNVRVPATCCCSFHVRVNAMRKVVAWLQTRPCKELFLSNQFRQCSVCHAVARADAETGCFVCKLLHQEGHVQEEAVLPEAVPLVGMVPDM